MKRPLNLCAPQVGVLLLALILTSRVGQTVLGQGAASPSAQKPALPEFRVDPYWPKPLPNKWAVGNVTGVGVDSRDNVYMVHRPKSQRGAQNTPPVLKFDSAGNLVDRWGGQATIPEWGTQEHSLHVDYKDNVWVSFSGGPAFQPPPPDPTGEILRNWKNYNWVGNAHVLKFSPTGKLLLMIGTVGKTEGSNSTTFLGGPTGLSVDSNTDEVYIADGYINRRIIVFDASTGAYKRHWGAYGKRPDDGPQPKFNPNGPPPPQFDTPHCVAVANDGLVYVCDRTHQRIQVFRRDGTFVKEAFIKGVIPWDIVLSRDSQQRLLIVPDGGNHVAHTVLRDSLEVVATFGQRGRWAGQFESPHHAAFDSTGNLFVVETLDGRRLQKFVGAAAGSSQ